MAYANGNATLNFGNAGGQIAFVTVAAQTTLLAGDKIEVWIMGTESTADNSAYNHKVIASKCSFTVENIVVGTSFDIFAISEITIFKTIQVSWVRST
jgi:hypothetical protein